MSEVIWWVGAIHIAAYVLAGSAFAIVWLVWKAHAHLKLVGRILQWHVARVRWKRRGENGLTDAEWQRGEPRP